MKMVAVEESSESSGEETPAENDESDEDPSTHKDAAHFFDDEAAVFLDSSEEVDSAHQRPSSRLSCTSNDGFSLPPGTDTDAAFTDFGDEAEDDSETEVLAKVSKRTGKARSLSHDWDMVDVDTKHKKVSGRKAAQLQAELPEITTAFASSSQSAPTTASASAPAHAPAPAPPTSITGPVGAPQVPALSVLAVGPNGWLMRSEIATIVKGRTTTLAALNTQSLDIRKIIDMAIKTGTLMMLVDSTSCPVNDELKHLASAALRTAAEDLGFAKHKDVLERLQFGDNETYMKPLVNYVSQRVGINRKDLKHHQISTVLSAFDFSSDPLSRSKAQQLVLNYTYHYATKAYITLTGFVSQTGEYDGKRPFEHEVLAKYIAAMFFGSHGYAGILANNKHVFVSSLASKPEELEIPKALVALSIAAIHAILSDFSRQCNENFPPKDVGNVWKSAMGLLENIERLNKPRFHNLMHKLYLSASGTLMLSGRGLSNEDIFNAVDWSALAEEVPSASSTSSSTLQTEDSSTTPST
ncbi:hypothetical protein K435DRAFT_814077 [Dendrothele bispora CBS 962.96]|uniref:DUF6532 domain-containing protein n=1 Tax=Dendrothele bispora (strain CBS 962.96) TaxID=1314807 RepID=A0A4S8KK30_DENBC|nr:hypothetical protein K435DRAFT_814077 [Dendrothele bispora CBS 962.96]